MTHPCKNHFCKEMTRDSVVSRTQQGTENMICYIVHHRSINIVRTTQQSSVILAIRPKVHSFNIVLNTMHGKKQYKIYVQIYSFFEIKKVTSTDLLFTAKLLKVQTSNCLLLCGKLYVWSNRGLRHHRSFYVIGTGLHSLWHGTRTSFCTFTIYSSEMNRSRTYIAICQPICSSERIPCL